MSKGDQTTVKQILALPKQNAIDTNDQIQQFEDKVMSINSQSSLVSRLMLRQYCSNVVQLEN